MNKWIIFALLSPLSWALTNVLDGFLRRNFVKNDLALTWFAAFARLPLILVFFAAFGIGLKNVEAGFWMIVGGFLWTVPFFLYYASLEFEEPGRVALLIQMVNIATLIFAFLLINERLTGGEYLAFALLLFGGILAALKRTKSRWRFSKAFWLIGLASAVWSLSDVLFKKFEPAFESFPTAFSLYLLGGFLPAAIILFTNKKNDIIGHFKNLPGRAWRIILLDQAASMIGTASFAYALTLGKASLTTVIIGIQPLFVIIWSLVFSRMGFILAEDLRLNNFAIKFASFCLIMVGLLLL